MAAPVFAQVTVTANQPAYGFQVLPGDTRHVNVTIANGTTNEINWTVASTTGGATATLSASTNAFPWVDVTFGSTAGNCSISPASGSGSVTYTVSSTATVTVQAQSVDNTAVTADFTFDVCSNATQVFVVPFYEVLYASQPVDLQSWVFGNANQNVTWAITAQPVGGDGALADTSNRDTVFTASVAGRYTVTATSAADNTQTSSATFYVTGHTMPYAQTPSETMPVDCTVDPNETGTDYEVGPTQTYTTLSAAMTAIYNANSWVGSTVRVHNEDTTGKSPTTYTEYIQIKSGGTATQPFRICGVPDAQGNLPIIDGNNATGASWVSTGAAAGYGVVSLWSGPPTPYGNFNGMNPISSINGGVVAYPQPQYAVVEGLNIKNGNSDNSYYTPTGSLTTYVVGASCVNARTGIYDVIRGNEISYCDNGTFADFNGDNSGWAIFEGLTDWEGNHIHDNAVDVTNGNGFIHQLYIQGWLQLVQFNVIDKITLGAGGSNYKDRGVGTIFRYNYLADGEGNPPTGPGRVIDAGDNEDSAYWLFPWEYIPNNWAGGDTMGANLVAAWNDLWHSYYMYGNVMQNSISNWVVHYMGDHGYPTQDRTGWLDYYDNTINASTTNGYGIFDTDDNGGGTPLEYPQVLAENNIIWQSGSSGPCWNRVAMMEGGFVTNTIASGPLDSTTLPIPSTDACNTNNGWQGSSTGNITPFTMTSPINNHLAGISAANFLATSTQPFQTTYAPVVGQEKSGTILSGTLATMPVRYQFTPSTGYYSARLTPVTSTNGGIVGAVDNVVTYTLSTATTGAGSGTITGCAGSYAQNQSYTCTVTPASGSFIYSVAGCGGSGTATYSGSMPAANCTVTATFDLLPGSIWEGVGLSGVSIH